jgi:ribosomal protein S12 methylthiotransferase
MEVQQEIAFDFGDSLVGYELDVLIDQAADDGNFLGRIYADAPEIDGAVLVAGEGIDVGDLIPVEITGRDGYDLLGSAGDTEPEFVAD